MQAEAGYAKISAGYFPPATSITPDNISVKLNAIAEQKATPT
jgi:hypothetical protein